MQGRPASRNSGRREMIETMRCACLESRNSQTPNSRRSHTMARLERQCPRQPIPYRLITKRRYDLDDGLWWRSGDRIHRHRGHVTNLAVVSQIVVTLEFFNCVFGCVSKVTISSNSDGRLNRQYRSAVSGPNVYDGASNETDDGHGAISLLSGFERGLRSPARCRLANRPARDRHPDRAQCGSPAAQSRSVRPDGRLDQEAGARASDVRRSRSDP